MLRLLLVEDHHLVRRGMCALLNQLGKYKIVAEADSCAQVGTIAEEHPADVILLDLSLSDGNTLEIINSIRANPSHPRVLVLSMKDDAHTVQRALDFGANGFLSKRSVHHELETAIDTVWKQGRYLCHHAQAALAIFDENPNFGEPLTMREQEVLTLIIAGATTREIAAKLVISVKTVEKHRTHIMRKLGAQNLAELLTTSHQRQLVV